MDALSDALGHEHPYSQVITIVRAAATVPHNKVGLAIPVQVCNCHDMVAYPPEP
jgi:hypothetical protein